jgi:hypothetical protein
VQCKVLCSLGAGIVENKDVGFGTHIRLNTCSGGLPIIALVPCTTIGRSINIGCAFIALISCSFVVAGSPRLRAVKVSSFVRISSMGCKLRRAKMFSSAVVLGGLSRYSIILGATLFSISSTRVARDFEQFGL